MDGDATHDRLLVVGVHRAGAFTRLVEHADVILHGAQRAPVRRDTDVSNVAEPGRARSFDDEHRALDRLDLRRRNCALEAQRDDLLPDVERQRFVDAGT